LIVHVIPVWDDFQVSDTWGSVLSLLG